MQMYGSMVFFFIFVSFHEEPPHLSYMVCILNLTGTTSVRTLQKKKVFRIGPCKQKPRIFCGVPGGCLFPATGFSFFLGRVVKCVVEE